MDDATISMQHNARDYNEFILVLSDEDDDGVLIKSPLHSNSSHEQPTVPSNGDTEFEHAKKRLKFSPENSQVGTPNNRDKKPQDISKKLQEKKGRIAKELKDKTDNGQDGGVIDSQNIFKSQFVLTSNVALTPLKKVHFNMEEKGSGDVPILPNSISLSPRKYGEDSEQYNATYPSSPLNKRQSFRLTAPQGILKPTPPGSPILVSKKLQLCTEGWRKSKRKSATCLNFSSTKESSANYKTKGQSSSSATEPNEGDKTNGNGYSTNSEHQLCVPESSAEYLKKATFLAAFGMVPSFLTQQASEQEVRKFLEGIGVPFGEPLAASPDTITLLRRIRHEHEEGRKQKLFSNNFDTSKYKDTSTTNRQTQVDNRWTTPKPAPHTSSANIGCRAEIKASSVPKSPFDSAAVAEQYHIKQCCVLVERLHSYARSPHRTEVGKKFKK